MTTDRCSVLSGFFVLTRCRRTAAWGCGRCGKPLCNAHRGPAGLCPECVLAGQYPSPGTYGPDWFDRYRRWFYQESGSVYGDGSWYATLDAYDRIPFDPGGNLDPDYDGEDQRDLVDS